MVVFIVRYDAEPSPSTTLITVGHVPPTQAQDEPLSARVSPTTIWSPKQFWFGVQEALRVSVLEVPEVQVRLPVPETVAELSESRTSVNRSLKGQ